MIEVNEWVVGVGEWELGIVECWVYICNFRN